MTTKTTIGDRIREARLRLGWRQADLAEAADVDQSDISMWELGHHQPTVATLRKLANGLNMTVGELIGE